MKKLRTVLLSCILGYLTVGAVMGFIIGGWALVPYFSVLWPFALFMAYVMARAG